ncbi:MAG TPA: hypothetical protein VK395_32595 [Gemmataceae bacterium]|nr:hypothetical protein [Gemmataceae bacterium]
MTNLIRQWLERLASWPVVAVLAVPTLGLFLFFNFHPSMVPYLQQVGAGAAPLDMQLGYGPQDVQKLFISYGAEGRERYGLFLTIDMVFAISYGLFLATSLRCALRPPVATAESRWNDLSFLPLCAAAADCTENLCILLLLSVYPAVPAALAYTASTATIVKWLLAAISIVLILIAVGIRLTWRTRHRSTRQADQAGPARA